MKAFVKQFASRLSLKEIKGGLRLNLAFSRDHEYALNKRHYYRVHHVLVPGSSQYKELLLLAEKRRSSSS